MYIERLATELDNLSVIDKYTRVASIVENTKDENVKQTIADYLQQYDTDISLSEYIPKEEDMYTHYHILRGGGNVIGDLVLDIVLTNGEATIYIIDYDIKDTKGISSFRRLIEMLIRDYLITGVIVWK